MKVLCTLPRLAVILAAVFAASTAFGQGSLTPPGAPAPTMKTLDQIEARIPIAASTTQVHITQDGSYYLTGNITVSELEGILIETDRNVTLDLNGYAVSSTSAAGQYAGVAFAGKGSFVLRNGRIVGTATLDATTHAVTAGGFSYGVSVYGGCAAARIEDVEILNASADGMRIGAAATVISRCQVNTVGRNGIDSINALVDHCEIKNCPGFGISAAVVEHCTAASFNATGIAASQLIDNCQGSALSTTVNTAYGLSAQTISNSVGASAAGGAAVRATAAATNCTGVATGAGAGVSGSAVRGCTGATSTGSGIQSNYSVADSYGLATTTGYGIVGGTVTNSTGVSGTGTGITCAVATNCLGRTSGTAATAYGIDCNVDGVATNCSATAGSATASSLRAKLANGCVLGTGSQAAITNKVNTF